MQIDIQNDTVKGSRLPDTALGPSGALANQLTGTHFRIRSDEKRLFVLTGKSESTYEILYIR